TCRLACGPLNVSLEQTMLRSTDQRSWHHPGSDEGPAGKRARDVCPCHGRTLGSAQASGAVAQVFPAVDPQIGAHPRVQTATFPAFKPALPLEKSGNHVQRKYASARVSGRVVGMLHIRLRSSKVRLFVAL